MTASALHIVWLMLVMLFVWSGSAGGTGDDDDIDWTPFDHPDDNKTFEMDFAETEAPITSVTLFVPDDAKVSLGGVETRADGPMRYFSTSRLKDGESWSSYQVVVTVERDGKLVRREKTIDVNAGDSVNLRFDFEGDSQVASR